MVTKEIALDAAQAIGNRIGVDWNIVNVREFRKGLEVELEHGSHDPQTNVTNDDMVVTGKGHEYMIPVTAEIIQTMDEQGGTLVIAVPPGLLEINE